MMSITSSRASRYGMRKLVAPVLQSHLPSCCGCQLSSATHRARSARNAALRPCPPCRRRFRRRSRSDCRGRHREHRARCPPALSRDACDRARSSQLVALLVPGIQIPDLAIVRRCAAATPCARIGRCCRGSDTRTRACGAAASLTPRPGTPRPSCAQRRAGNRMRAAASPRFSRWCCMS